MLVNQPSSKYRWKSCARLGFNPDTLWQGSWAPKESSFICRRVKHFNSLILLVAEWHKQCCLQEHSGSQQLPQQHAGPYAGLCSPNPNTPLLACCYLLDWDPNVSPGMEIEILLLYSRILYNKFSLDWIYLFNGKFIFSFLYTDKKVAHLDCVHGAVSGCALCALFFWRMVVVEISGWSLFLTRSTIISV